MKRTLFILLILLFVFLTTTAQETVNVVIINNYSKTISRKIIKPNDPCEYNQRLVLPKKIYPYKEYEPSIDTILYPKDIKGFILENKKIYKSEKLANNKNEIVFMEEILKEGSLTIYSYQQSSSEKETLYMRNGDDKPLVEVDSNCEPFRSYISENIAQCGNLSMDDFKNMKPERYTILNSYKALTNCNIKYFDRKIRIGVSASFGFSSISQKDESEISHASKDNSVGFNPGIFVDIPFSYKQFSFRPEIFYQNDSYENNIRIPLTQTSYPDSKNMRYTYKRESLVIPATIRYTHISKQATAIPYVEGGILGGYAFTNSYKLTSAPDEQVHHDWRNIADSMNKIYFGLVVGAGVETYLLKNNPTYFGIRYIHTTSGSIRIHNVLLSASISVF